MNIKSLKIFCDIVTQRSFSRAASDNGISQSGASQVVSQLEGRLGVQLIERSKRPLVLTREGKVFYDGCRPLIAGYEALEDEVRTLHEDVAGRVHVAAIYSVGLHHMSRHVQEFMARHPKANIRLEYLHPERVLALVEEGQADVGIVSYPRSTRAVSAIAWREERIVVACAPNHPFADCIEISINDLEGQRVVGFDSDLVIRHELDRVITSHGVTPKIVMEFDNIETIKRAVEIDAGVALLPEPTVSREVAAGTLRAVKVSDEKLVRPLGIGQARNKPLGPTARRFVDMLHEHADDAVAECTVMASA